MTKLSELAKKYYESGCSCSESIIKSAYDTGIFKTDNFDEVNRIASMFSGGMSSGCLCGAVAGAQIVLGCLFGKNINDNTSLNRTVSAELIKKFKEKRKVTCCNALSAAYKENPVARRQNCISIVEDSAGMLENIVNSYTKNSFVGS
jgi:C_GCAxxG_C_C family probable redox protein